MSQIPVDPLPDLTLNLLRDGYDFVSKRADKLNTDVFRGRLMLKPAIFVRGAAAAEMFYDGDRFTRQGAMPTSVLKLLQDQGSVQTLDGVAHRHRKAMFISFLMHEGQVDRLAAIFREEWLSACEDWERAGEISLFDAVNAVLTRAALRWTGVPVENQQLSELTAELSSMIENAGRVGLRNWVARARRQRTERFFSAKLDQIRRGELPLAETMPARIIADHRDLNGSLLDLPTATVELINVLRPIVAIGRYIVFSAMALHEHPQLAEAFRRDDDVGSRLAFAEEVRRLYPFFPVVGGIARRDFEWRGHRIAGGEWVILDIHGTTHDPRLFSDPSRFDPERIQSWRDQDHRLIPQGAGNAHLTHRCPGEMITVQLMAEAIRLLVQDMSYRVPPQDLSMPPNRIPALPKTGMRLAAIRRQR